MAELVLANTGACEICVRSACILKKSNGDYLSSIQFEPHKGESFTFSKGEIVIGKAILFPIKSSEAEVFRMYGDDFVIEIVDYDGWTYREPADNGLALG